MLLMNQLILKLKLETKWNIKIALVVYVETHKKKVNTIFVLVATNGTTSGISRDLDDKTE